jgi:hypothetical protein
VSYDCYLCLMILFYAGERSNDIPAHLIPGIQAELAQQESV